MEEIMRSVLLAAVVSGCTGLIGLSDALALPAMGYPLRQAEAATIQEVQHRRWGSDQLRWSRRNRGVHRRWGSDQLRWNRRGGPVHRRWGSDQMR